MNVAVQPMTPDDFLVWCLDQPDRWELADGDPVCAGGASQQHDAVVVNLIAALGTWLRGTPIRPHTAAIAARTGKDAVRRPDVTIDCGPIDRAALTSAAPTVFLEVLSPSTRTFDRFRKTEEYKAVPSLRHIVLIDPDRPRVWLWSRGDEATLWSDQDIAGLDAVVPLSAIAVDLPMAAIYNGIEIEAD